MRSKISPIKFTQLGSKNLHKTKHCSGDCREVLVASSYNDRGFS